MGKLEPYKDGAYLWNYVPSMVAALIFIILFFVATGAHLWRMIKAKARFCIPFVIGCAFEVIGYAARANANNNTGKLMPYALQSLFILIAPALFAASIYMTLGRVIRRVQGEKHSLVRVNWLTKTFVIGDISSFIIQCGASGLMFQNSTRKLGEDIVIGGLFVQIIMFALFFLTAVIFHVRIRRLPTPTSATTAVPWEQILYMLYAVSALILFRSIFRAIEYIMGQDGYPLEHEWTLYIFDSVPMFAVTVIFFIWYPSRIQGADEQPDGRPMANLYSEV